MGAESVWLPMVGRDKQEKNPTFFVKLSLRLFIDSPAPFRANPSVTFVSFYMSLVVVSSVYSTCRSRFCFVVATQCRSVQ